MTPETDRTIDAEETTATDGATAPDETATTASGEVRTDEMTGEVAAADDGSRHTWRQVRRYLLGAGVAVFCLGLVVVLVPGADRLLPVAAVVAALGSDYVAVALIGLAAVGLSVLAVLVRRLRGVDEANPAVVEGVQSATYPGSAFDRVTGEAGSRDDRDVAPEAHRDRLRTAAVRTVMRVEGCSRTAARRRVAAGEWTDERGPASFLSEEFDADGPRPREEFEDVTTSRELVRDTAAAVDRLAGADPDEHGDEPGRREGPPDAATSTVDEDATGSDAAPARGRRATDGSGRREHGAARGTDHGVDGDDGDREPADGETEVGR